MKILITLMSASVIFIISSVSIYSQDNNDSSASSDEKSFVSPRKLEKLQNEELPAEKRDSQTLRYMYRRVNFIDMRSIDATVVMNSGFSDEKRNFDSLSGYNFGLTWEFPILAKKLGGDTPILKARFGKSEIKSTDSLSEAVQVSSVSENFVESLGVSEVYTVGFGGGYCYHIGFDCVYVMYNTYLTGQLSTIEDDGSVSTVPTQLKGLSLGMTSSFETFLGVELTVGMEYSVLTHSTPISADQQINTLSLVFALGFLEQSRYLDMRQIDFVE